MRHCWLLLILPGVGLLGCGRGATPTVAVAGADLDAAVASNNAFAFDLYRQLRKQPGNHGFSPSSIATGLAMSYRGAKGETARQMAETLHLGPRPQSCAAALGRLQAPPAAGAGVQVEIANALWIKTGLSLRTSFAEAIRTEFGGGGAQEVDFDKGGVDAINDWVRRQTHDQISRLVERSDLTGLTRLIVVNAIAMKGKWASRFLETRTLHFFPTAETSFPHLMMGQAFAFGYAQTQTVQILEMPYEGGEISMVVVLPLKRDGLAEVEELLTTENWSKWTGWLKATTVNVHLPRFKLDKSYRLDEVLPEMGMPLAFDRDQADFSGMVEGSNPDHQLHIDKVIHKMHAEVDETGTEAVGASMVIHEAKSAPGERLVPVERPPEFMANHPFVFLIRNRKSGAILFCGRIVDPRAN